MSRRNLDVCPRTIVKLDINLSEPVGQFLSSSRHERYPVKYPVCPPWPTPSRPRKRVWVVGLVTVSLMVFERLNIDPHYYHGHRYNTTPNRLHHTDSRVNPVKDHVSIMSWVQSVRTIVEKRWRLGSYPGVTGVLFPTWGKCLLFNNDWILLSLYTIVSTCPIFRRQVHNRFTEEDLRDSLRWGTRRGSIPPTVVRCREEPDPCV